MNGPYRIVIFVYIGFVATVIVSNLLAIATYKGLRRRRLKLLRISRRHRL